MHLQNNAESHFMTIFKKLKNIKNVIFQKMSKKWIWPNFDEKTKTLHEMDAQGLFWCDSDHGDVSFSRRIARKPRFYRANRVLKKIEVLIFAQTRFYFLNFFDNFTKMRPGGGSLSSKLNSHDFCMAFFRLLSKSWRYHDQNRKKNKPWAPISCKVCVFLDEIRQT